MKDLIIYLLLACVGYALGNRIQDHQKVTHWTDRLQIAAIGVLLFTMGLRIGSNQEVTSNLGSIGLISAAMTLMIMFFSAVFAFFARKIVGMDRWARIQSAAPSDFDLMQAEKTDEKSAGKNSDGSRQQKIMAVLVIVSVTAGLLCGYLFIADIFGENLDTFNTYAGLAVNTGLYVLLFIIGFNMGLDGTVIENFKKVGARIILFPFVIMAGAAVAAVLCAWIFHLDMRESFAVTAGFGWYSLAPGIILEAGLIRCGAISFMHCVMREYFSLLLVPLIAKKVGYMEAVGICGAAAMGVCLPVVERSTRGDVAIYSFICGMIQTVFVPILLPLILG